MDKPTHFFKFFFVDEIQGVEVLDFGGNLAGKLGCVKLSDSGHSALASQQVGPNLSAVIADGTNKTDPGDDNTP